MTVHMLTPQEELNFWLNVIEDENGCWIWHGRRGQRGGYGMHGDGSYAHRTAYQLLRGRIPQHFTIDHLCRVKCCVNPDHMETVSMKENILRGDNPPSLNARKTHCKRGHEFTPENTYRHVVGGIDRGRVCRTCRLANNPRYWATYMARQHGNGGGESMGEKT